MGSHGNNRYIGAGFPACAPGRLLPGTSIDELLAEYPYLERDDILQALRYAAWLPEGRAFELTIA
jgi:hypothetical protein